MCNLYGGMLMLEYIFDWQDLKVCFSGIIRLMIRRILGPIDKEIQCGVVFCSLRRNLQHWRFLT